MALYDVRIGLEIHVELKTDTKLFCACPNSFGDEPNTRCCPVCLGLPGSMPSVNAKAVEYAVRAGLAMNCTIPHVSKWVRKNYFYPDLPKAWQTSQLDMPIAKDGYVEYFHNGDLKSAGITRIQLEEDAGKLIHEHGKTRIDYNRCGVPLIEIVTEPDFSSGDEAVAFLKEIRNMMRLIGVSDVKMQEGSLRCDVNLSVSEHGAPRGIRTETKNLNSFKAVARSCNYEADRQIELLAAGKAVVQETRRWDDVAGVGYGMRTKQDSADYRFFREPDLLPIMITDEEIESIKSALPPSRKERMEKYCVKFGLSRYDAEILASDYRISLLFEGAASTGVDPKRTANIIICDVLKMAKRTGEEDPVIGIDSKQLAEIVMLIDSGKVGLTTVQKDILPNIWDTDMSAGEYAENNGLMLISDACEIEKFVRRVIEDNRSVADDYASGNEKVIAFLIGRVMKITNGKCDAKLAGETIKKILNKQECKKK